MNYEILMDYIEKFCNGDPACIVALQFDNDRIVYYLDEDFDPADAKDFDGELMVYTRAMAASVNKFGGSLNIPVIQGHSGLQAVISVANAEDKAKLDRDLIRMQ